VYGSVWWHIILLTCNHFRLFSKEYLTHLHNSALTSRQQNLDFKANGSKLYVKLCAVFLEHPILDPGVDGVKRLRLTPKLFDWLVDASHFFRRRRRGIFSTAITTRLIRKISRVVATSAHVPTTTSDHVRSLEKGGKNPVRAHSIVALISTKRYSAHCAFIQYAVINHNQHKIPTL